MVVTGGFDAWDSAVEDLVLKSEETAIVRIEACFMLPVVFLVWFEFRAGLGVRCLRDSNGKGKLELLFDDGNRCVMLLE